MIGCMVTTNQKLLAAAPHLSYLVGLPILVPILIYIWKRDDAFVADHAKQALGVHALLVVAMLVAFLILGIAHGFHDGDLERGVFGGLALLVAAFTIVAALRVADGKPYSYPLIGRLVKRW